MLTLVNNIVKDSRVKVDLCPLLDHGPITTIHAIIMHQTGGSTAAGTLSKYKDPKAEHTGAHFLLDKDGTMYQTLALNRRAAQVAPIKSRCLAEKRCTPKDLAAYAKINKELRTASQGKRNRAIGAYEGLKQYPDRYPYNPDAIGIEVVGRFLTSTKSYENVTPQQNVYLHWFVKDLMQALKLTDTDIYRHPQLSAKEQSEAANVTW